MEADRIRSAWSRKGRIPNSSTWGSPLEPITKGHREGVALVIQQHHSSLASLAVQTQLPWLSVTKPKWACGRSVVLTAGTRLPWRPWWCRSTCLCWCYTVMRARCTCRLGRRKRNGSHNWLERSPLSQTFPETHNFIWIGFDRKDIRMKAFKG